MDIDPQPKTVVCYGDSNTWGQVPTKRARQPVGVRWTSRLQTILGSRFYVIEEGLVSRTTDLEYKKKPGRNGKVYLQPCLESHNPISVVVLMLGTTDLKAEYGRSGQDVANALEGLINDINAYASTTYVANNPPRTVLVSPIHINTEAPLFAEFYKSTYNETSAATSRELASVLRPLAENCGCAFMDASRYAKAGEDGIHFDDSSHERFANALAKLVTTLA